MRLSPQKFPLIIHYGIFATVAFSSTALFAGLLLSTGASPAHAEETEIDVNVPASIALTASPTTVNIGTLAPESFGSAYTDLTVSTNSAGGYSLKIASATSSTSLVHSNGSATGHIDSITTPVTINTTGSNFPGDKWGYSIGQSASSTSKDYQIVPASTSATEIAHKETPVMDDVTRVNFGTRPTSSSASGTYSGTVTFTATAKDIPKDITFLNSMQDLATHPEYCTNSTVGTTVLLPDSRDSKQYRVRRLSDGNCWMIDSLRLGTVGQNIVLTQQDSDVSANVTIPSSAIVNSDGQGSWTGSGTSSDESFYKDWHVYQREDTTYGGTKTAPTVSGNRYGSLYNWHTATAGTSDFDATQGTNMTSSICPKGWRLPDGHTVSADRPKTFQALYDQYDTQAKMTETETGTGPEFVISGLVFEDGSSTLVGTQSSYWSRTAYGWSSKYSRWYASSLSLIASAVYPQSGGYQTYGLSVRCVSAQ